MHASNIAPIRKPPLWVNSIAAVKLFTESSLLMLLAGTPEEVHHGGQRQDVGIEQAGNDLKSGNGAAQNPSLAFKYMKMAAEGGYSKAYRPLAEMYHKGAGVAKDRDIAAKWYQRAADSGDRKALYILNNL